MSLKKMMLAIYTLAVSLFASAQAIHAQSPAPSNLAVQIKKVEYRGQKDGAHNILVGWDQSKSDAGYKIVSVTLEVELTDAANEKRTMSQSYSLPQAGSGKVSLTPIPIPKEPIIAVPLTALFRNPRNLDGASGAGVTELKVKVKLTATAKTLTGASRTITGSAIKTDSLKVKR